MAFLYGSLCKIRVFVLVNNKGEDQLTHMYKVTSVFAHHSGKHDINTCHILFNIPAYLCI